MSSKKSTDIVGSIIAATVILALGAGATVVMIKSRAEAKQQEIKKVAIPVEVERAHYVDTELKLSAQGSVLPRRKVMVMPSLSGRVVWKNPKLQAGALIRKGEQLVRIEASDYAAQVAQNRAQLAMRRLDLARERAAQEVAKAQWERLSDAEKKRSADAKDLTLRVPHLRAAEATVAAAKSALGLSLTHLGRTVVTAPFDAFVRTENVDVGQLIGPSSAVANLVSTKTFRVQASVPLDQVGYIRFPEKLGGRGSEVALEQKLGSKVLKKKGYVVGLLGDVDTTTRLARVLIDVPDPFGIGTPAKKPKAARAKGAKKAVASEPPVDAGLNQRLLLGSYVRVLIGAGKLSHVVVVPRSAVHEGTKIYVLDKDSKLDIRKVHVAHRSENVVMVDRGLSEGEQMIVSQVANPAKGIKLRALGKVAKASTGKKQ